MGTVLYDRNGLQIKRFYGGSKRGVCVQITTGDDFLQLTALEFTELTKAIIQLVAKDIMERILKVKL